MGFVCKDVSLTWLEKEVSFVPHSVQLTQIQSLSTIRQSLGKKDLSMIQIPKQIALPLPII
jgi:hypothetical protein